MLFVVTRRLISTRPFSLGSSSTAAIGPMAWLGDGSSMLVTRRIPLTTAGPCNVPRVDTDHSRLPGNQRNRHDQVLDRLSNQIADPSVAHSSHSEVHRDGRDHELIEGHASRRVTAARQGDTFGTPWYPQTRNDLERPFRPAQRELQYPWRYPRGRWAPLREVSARISLPLSPC